jgi:hypothetical protein
LAELPAASRSLKMWCWIEHLATQSDAQNLAVEDAIDERPFNQAIWQSIHGPGSVMPEPRPTHD